MSRNTDDDEPTAVQALMAAVERNHAEQDALADKAAKERRELRAVQNAVRKDLGLGPLVHRRGGRSNGLWDHEQRVYGGGSGSK